MKIKIKRAYDSYSDDDGYLERMIDIIVRHEGTIDEFTGYGILVFFGAPRLLPNHTRQAVACAFEMQESMKELNRENFRLGLPNWKWESVSAAGS